MTEAKTPAGIPSLVEALRQLARRQRQYGATNDEKIDKTCSLTVGNLDEAAEALSPKEAELVKPPREYEVSGDAVGGVIQADREAAWPYAPSPQDAVDVRQGKADDLPCVQAFAAHRLAYTPKAPPTTDASERMRETFNEGLWTGWRAGLAGEQMNDDYASTSWDVSDAAAQLDTASERMREAGQ